MLARLARAYKKKSTLIDFPSKKGCLDLSFELTRFFENFNEYNVTEFFTKLGDTGNIDGIAKEKVKKLLPQLFLCKKTFKFCEKSGLKMFVKFIKDLTLEDFAFILRFTENGMKNREQHFFEEILNCKKDKILALLGCQHLKPLHKLLSNDDRVALVEDIKSF